MTSIHLGLWGNIGIMEKKMETTILGLFRGFRVEGIEFWDVGFRV